MNKFHERGNRFNKHKSFVPFQSSAQTTFTVVGYAEVSAATGYMYVHWQHGVAVSMTMLFTDDDYDGLEQTHISKT